MKILFAASEVTPLAKTGGLADVAGALPKALKKLGHDVRIIMPFYRCVEKGGHGIRKGRKSVEIEMGGVVKKGLLRWTELADIPVYLLENPEYFHRDHLYGTPLGDYPDNPQRFAFFCRGVLQLLKKMDFRPDVIHCNDWQTALIPLLLAKELSDDPFYARSSTVLTIHNLAYQGLFPRSSMAEMGLDWSFFSVDLLEFYDKVNLLKGGLVTADVLTTVSERYREEIQTPEYGCGLEGVLAGRDGDLHGILNGIDTMEWDPQVDPSIARNYSPASPAGKSACKKALQKQLGLPQEELPLIGIVSRLSSQKGFDLVEQILPRLAEQKAQAVIFGEGEQRIVEALSGFSAPNIVVKFGFQSELARRIYAGSDIFLMPSRYEPCGLGQMIALRYGAVPVVRRTGGLADTVTDPQTSQREANGFTFDEYDAEALWEALQRALQGWENRGEWKKLMRRGMNGDYSWEKSARTYQELYQATVNRRRSEHERR